MDTIIIKGCLNGSRGREDNPNVPWTPEEVAQEAVRCYEAGASIVHFHARTPDGGISYDPAWYAQTDAMIRAQCDLALNHTTARQSHVPVEAVTRYLLETPQPVEMVSLNLGTGTRWPVDAETGRRRTTISPNSFEDIVATLDACYQRGTFPEPAVHDTGNLNLAFTLMAEGYIKDTRYFLVEPGGHWGDGRQTMVGSPRNYMLMADTIREHYPEATWLAHSSASQTFRCAPSPSPPGRTSALASRTARSCPTTATHLQRPVHRMGRYDGATARAGAGHAATGAGNAGVDTVPRGVAIMGRQEADAIGLAVARAAQEAAPEATVILFGSRARGDHRPDSDVDLMVIADTDDRMVLRAIQGTADRAAYRKLREFPVKFGYDVIGMTRERFDYCRRARNHVAAQALRDGVIMNDDEFDDLGDEFEDGYPAGWPDIRQRLINARLRLGSLNRMIDMAFEDQDLIGFVAQQAVENALKGWISAIDCEYTNIHRIESTSRHHHGQRGGRLVAGAG